MFAKHPTIAHRWAQEGKADMAMYKVTPIKKTAAKKTVKPAKKTRSSGATKVETGGGFVRGAVKKAGGSAAAAAAAKKSSPRRVATKKK